MRARQKYSTEQKQAAIAHYLDRDRFIASTMRAMGYQCRGTLMALIDQLHPPVRQRVVGRPARRPLRSQRPLPPARVALADSQFEAD